MYTAQPVHNIHVYTIKYFPLQHSGNSNKNSGKYIFKIIFRMLCNIGTQALFLPLCSERRPSWSRKSRETRTEKVTSSSGSLADNLCHRHISPWFSKVCKGASLPNLPTALDWPHTCASLWAPRLYHWQEGNNTKAHMYLLFTDSDTPLVITTTFKWLLEIGD